MANQIGIDLIDMVGDEDLVEMYGDEQLFDCQITESMIEEGLLSKDMTTVLA